MLALAGKVDGFGVVSAVALTQDHTPADQLEAKRVLESGVSLARLPRTDRQLPPAGVLSALCDKLPYGRVQPLCPARSC
jgi:hypothetical protein